MSAKKHPNEGTRLDDFLKEEGVFDKFKARVAKEAIVWQLQEAMKARHLSKKRLAELMHTSRPQVDRLLNPSNGNVTLETLHRAAEIVGRKVKLELV